MQYAFSLFSNKFRNFDFFSNGLIYSTLAFLRLYISVITPWSAIFSDNEIWIPNILFVHQGILKIIKMANKRKPVTMEEMNRNWDDWWNSLTDSQKQKLVEEQEAMEKEKLDG